MHDHVTAAFSVRLDNPGTKEPKTTIQYLPAGTHEITAKVNGEAATRQVVVEAGIEKVYQADLEKLQAENVPPFIDYLHEGGRAAGHPKQFGWDEERGLTLEIEWTENAKNVIASKELQFFSPEFLLTEDGQPAGLHPVNKAIGGLVSDPAFTSIESIAAAKAAAKHKKTQPNNLTMDLTKLVELGVITAEQAKDPEKAMAIVADQVTALRSDKKLTDLQGQLVIAQKEKEAAEAKVTAMRETEADAFISEHVTAGRIKAKDEAAKDFWRSQFMTDADVAKAQIVNLPASDITAPVAKVAAGKVETEEESGSLYAQAKEMIQAGKAKSYHEAIRTIGASAYGEYRTDMGLGEEAALAREQATHALMSAARKNN